MVVVALSAAALSVGTAASAASSKLRITAVSTKAEYVTFLSDLMPTLPGYAMDVTRVTYAQPLAFAELSETVAVDGTPLRTPECLTFELTDDGRIRRVEVFTQTRHPVA